MSSLVSGTLAKCSVRITGRNWNFVMTFEASIGTSDVVVSATNDISIVDIIDGNDHNDDIFFFFWTTFGSDGVGIIVEALLREMLLVEEGKSKYRDEVESILEGRLEGISEDILERMLGRAIE